MNVKATYCKSTGVECRLQPLTKWKRCRKGMNTPRRIPLLDFFSELSLERFWTWNHQTEKPLRGMYPPMMHIIISEAAYDMSPYEHLFLLALGGAEHQKKSIFFVLFSCSESRFFDSEFCYLCTVLLTTVLLFWNCSIFIYLPISWFFFFFSSLFFMWGRAGAGGGIVLGLPQKLNFRKVDSSREAFNGALLELKGTKKVIFEVARIVQRKGFYNVSYRCANKRILWHHKT